MNYRLVKRAVIIAIVVGTLLNLINQHDALAGHTPFNWLKAILTYCVPFCVSLFSSWLAIKDAKTHSHDEEMPR
ncbi:nitrate/nitrite transporter NrtS [Vibrio ostreicida]|uniref:Nitrate/nitrite transporter NrtS n=1 Tax=Vibrio ostreicida TaxID=526588 RepID=A0ABT8BQS9_9VIBR|nr:nitrate/nitrite transporter NrtS [Vibrio ostreicida]MDN3609497.1 nitrate/nitrite transporter NrtS [Vibrio ostreicida]NPD08377.1 nitrate/nitrite transporter NrtS [Vibrio ostreicida]